MHLKLINPKPIPWQVLYDPVREPSRVRTPEDNAFVTGIVHVINVLAHGRALSACVRV